MYYLLRILTFLTLFHSINVQYILYHSNDQNSLFSAYDCLYAVWNMDDQLYTSAPYIRNYYLIPYCRRPDHLEEEHSIDFIDENMVKKMNSRELKQQNITGNDLLNWSLPIDVVEEYEMKNESVFFNCSLPWFGSKCQYRFPYDISMTFNEIVSETFHRRSTESLTTGTCYRFIETCNDDLWPLCLDWREICDQKVDCPNGEDERRCEELELNQCNQNEYRCHNGQCIPLKFAWESLTSVDCLDGSDERDIFRSVFAGEPSSYNHNCLNLPIFRCEERTARYPRQFVCGDGQYTHGPYVTTMRTVCENNRDIEVIRRLFTSLDHIEDEKCRDAFYCVLHSNRNLHPTNPPVRILRFEDSLVKDCEFLRDKCSLEWLFLPKKATMFGIFQFIYFTNRSIDEFKQNIQPDLTCFDIDKCSVLTDVVVNATIINGLTCILTSILTQYDQAFNFDHFIGSFREVLRQCLTKGTDTSCNNSNEFHCSQSMKCILYNRVQDGYPDCYFKEDEKYSACSLNDSSRFRCRMKTNLCLSPVAISNGFSECGGDEDEKIHQKQDFNKTASYSKFCLGSAAQYLAGLGYIDKQNKYCDLWPCDSPYVHCDKIWDCPNGIDELNCSYTNCSSNKHECQDDSLGSTYCIPISQIVDETIPFCHNGVSRSLYFINGSTIDENKYYSWNKTKCLYANNICRTGIIFPITVDEDACLYDRNLPQIRGGHSVMSFDTRRRLCDLKIDTVHQRKERFLTAFRLGNFPVVTSLSSIKHISIIDEEKKKYIPMNISQTWFCHRGILVLSGNNQTKTCLCPPSYFGSQCQLQSQRISLTFEIISPRATFITDSFQVIIMLINEQDEIVGNHEEILFIPARDCQTKFHLYLLYPQRSKSLSNNYSIRIDLFDKITLKHWTSWYLSIPFQFLPVNRISTQLFIPKEQTINVCPLFCGLHGQCMYYTNNEVKYFCQCDQGYSGSFCNESYQCQCAENSFCLSPTICICPLDRFGSKCYLKRSICFSINNPCQNEGLCIPKDGRIDLHGYSCFCKEHYFGLHCEHSSSRINLMLDITIARTSSIVFIHFITTFEHAQHERTTIMKKIPVDSNTIIFSVSKQFNFVFLQLLNQSYYLVIVREIFIPSENIHSEILSKQHCPYVKQFLNSTFLEYEQFYHPSFYPLVCRQNLHLMCFYDESLLCICDLDRFANCFVFNHTLDNTCQGHNDCKNDGQCFQNNQTCPTMSICACQNCFYGGKCQMSTEGNLLSLDPIIGYYIKPNASFYHQPLIIKVTMGITLLIFILGLIDVLLSILTFHMKNPREVGCGYYLLASSIISFCMIIMFGIKFLYLILSQMKMIKDEFQLLFACKSIDMLLKSLLASNEWIIACVAMERVLNTINGPSFNKRKSQQLAKWIIPIVISSIFISHLHDPYYRQLIHDTDEDEKRIWCFVRYPSMIDTYNSFITLMHFIGPLIINTISAFLIIIFVSRSRSNIQRNKSFHQHLQEQLKRHKHLLISPLALVLLGTPRLVFSFVSGCMRTPRDSWFYVFGYYFSFIPPILTFPAFVLPSSNYRKVFQSAIQQQLIRFQSTFLSKF